MCRQPIGPEPSPILRVELHSERFRALAPPVEHSERLDRYQDLAPLGEDKLWVAGQEPDKRMHPVGKRKLVAGRCTMDWR